MTNIENIKALSKRKGYTFIDAAQNSNGTWYALNDTDHGPQPYVVHMVCSVNNELCYEQGIYHTKLSNALNTLTDKEG